MRKKGNFITGRKVFTLLVVLILSIALYGCEGDKTEDDEGKNPSDTSISSKEPTYGGSVVVGITQDLDSLDPHKAIAAGTKEVLFNVFEGLVKPDKEGFLVPAVASDSEISTDGKTYRFTLREGVRFHNGELVTVEDIIYSISRSAGLLETTDSSVVMETALSNILEVKSTDEKTVEIILKEPDTELMGYLTVAIIPADYKEQSTKPIGTGPFKFVSYSPLTSFKLERNEDYWQDGRPYLDEVTFKISSNTDAAFMELQSGAIDIFPYLTDDQAMQLESTLTIETGNMNLVQGLFLNNAVAPFDDHRVREAFNYAIDKQAILDMVAGGKGNIIGSNMFTGFSKYYEDLSGFYSYDVEKAKKLLKEAGYNNDLEFTITVPSNYQFHVNTAEVIVEQLKAVGVTAKIKLVEWSSWLTDVYKERNYQSTVIGLDAKLAPRDVLERYTSAYANNFMNYKSSEYDEIISKALVTVVEKEKIAYYKRLQAILAEDAASVYIQDPALLVAVNKELGGYTFYPVYVQDMASVYFIK
jgi:peptide/nickel transport system substrate-binding protein